VTSSLRSFLENHSGQHVALAVNGVYLVTQMSVTAHDLVVDFRGARLVGSERGAHGILRLQDSVNVTLNDARGYGTNASFEWVDADQYEHGISIVGGSKITLNRPFTRNTRGDGIYTSSSSSAPTGVVINNPDIAYAGRNGIAPVAGEVTIRGGTINHVGLHGVDFEVNDATDARSIIGVVDGTDIRNYGDLPVETGNYAVAAGGDTGGMKQSMLIQNLTGDQLEITVRYTTSAVVTDNVSDQSATADFPGCGSVTFTNNVRITRH